MDEPIGLKDYSVNFYFYFIGIDNRIKSVDPRIGNFRLRQITLVYENGIFTKNETSFIDYHEVDMKTDKRAASLMPFFKDAK